MTELTELEEGLRKLKKDNLEKKRLIAELESEKKYVEERNRYLIEKLKQAGVLYEEAGRRLLDFVNDNVKPVKARLEGFETRLQKIREYDVSIGSALKRVDEFGVVVGNFKNEMVKHSEKQAAMTATMNEFKKSVNEMSKRVASVQTFGSEELAEKVEEIKAKFGEDVRKIEDEFSVLRIGVGNSIDSFKKEFERQANALRNDMEKVDIKKAKELGDALAHVTGELDKAKVDFSKGMASMERVVERLDVKKTKEMNEALATLSVNLDEKFGGLAEDVNKKVLAAEESLNKFRLELEKTLNRAKIETRDFVASKSKEFDALLAQLKEKMNSQMEASVKEWNTSLGSLRSELVATKNEVERLIATINRKVEIGEERREKKIETSLAQLNALLAKKFEGEAEQLYGQVDEVNQKTEELKENLAKAVESLKKASDTSEAKRKAEISKIIKEFMTVKGAVDEKIREVSAELEKFSKASETLRRQITRESLAGVQDRVKAIFEEMEKKFEVVEDSMIDKMASMESDIDELEANFQGVASSLKAEHDKKLDFLRKEFERRDLKRENEAGTFAKALQKSLDDRVSAIISKLDAQLREMDGETSAVRKDVDNFTVDLSEKFDAIIKTKSKEFERTASSLVADMRSMEKEVNLAINAFKKDIEKTELQKKAEVDRTLKDFVAEKGRIDEKISQIDKKIAEISEMRKELKKEIYRESLSGVNERVKDIIEGVEEKFDASKEDLENKFGEVGKGLDTRIREVEANLGGFRVELEKTLGKLRTDVDKVTGRKTGEMDRLIEKLRFDVDTKVNSAISELSDKLVSLRKETEISETKRTEKIEKIKKDTDLLSENLKTKFQAGEKERWNEVNKALKELMVIRGDTTRRLQELDGEIKKIYGIKDSLKEGVMQDSSSLVENRLASFIRDNKSEMAEGRKAIKAEVNELGLLVSKLSEKFGRLNDKIAVLREEIYSVKKARAALMEDAKATGQTVESNVELMLRNFMKDMEKRMRTQEKVLDSRMAEVEKKITSVSDSLVKTKKEKEEELEEILKHVEA
jgi:chromosome segregation ATPase